VVVARQTVFLMDFDRFPNTIFGGYLSSNVIFSVILGCDN